MSEVVNTNFIKKHNHPIALNRFQIAHLFNAIGIIHYLIHTKKERMRSFLI